MHLSSLTLRGFKSFAERTTFDLGPGVTVIVGPNGSGKSNVVDALTWVLGTQSPRSLRGGAMADVVFAGAPGRGALGRAEVEITIDNADGAVPVEFAEVTVGRAVFASGETEYSINGQNCRQLDVAELLSDAGLGRESHTIVGQGRLDAILTARPEDRRAFIDEAAGIAKHRRRKERATRKLEQMSEHAERLNDLVRELRRSLRPLERQAEAASRHAELSTRLRAARIELVTDTLLRASREHHALSRRHDRHVGMVEQLEQRATDARAEARAAEQTLDETRPAVEQAASTHFRLSNVRERLHGVVNQIDERRRGLRAAADDPVPVRSARDVRAERAAATDERARSAANLAERMEALTRASVARTRAEQARRAHEQAVAAEARRRAAARERRLRWEGEVAAVRSALAQAASEQGRVDGRLDVLREREATSSADVAAAQRAVTAAAADRERRVQVVANADTLVTQRRATRDAAVDRERVADRTRAATAARHETLAAAAAHVPDGTAALLAAGVPGINGRLADHVRVADGYALAVDAALERLADALVADGHDSAVAAAEVARTRDAGRVRVLADRPEHGASAAAQDRSADRPAGADSHAASPPEVTIVGARRLLDVLDGPPQVLRSLARALGSVVVVDDYAAACALADDAPELVVVTVAGELAGAAGYVAGSASPASAVGQQARLRSTRTKLDDDERTHARATAEVAATSAALDSAVSERATAASALTVADRQVREHTDRLRRLQAAAQASAQELAAIRQTGEQLETELSARRDRLAALEASGEPDSQEYDQGPDVEAERLDDVLRAAREDEVDHKVAVSAAASHRDDIARRIATADREIERLEAAAEAAAKRRSRREAAIVRCDALATVAGAAAAAADAALEASTRRRAALEHDRDSQQRALGVLRAGLADAERAHAAYDSDRHADELELARAVHILEDARSRARDLGIDPATAIDASAIVLTEERRAHVADDAEQLAQQLALLGPVNPLAVDEYEALEQRQRFLAEQIDDLERSRGDLLEVIATVDDRICEIFRSAFDDVAAQFEQLFGRLFPGGEGTLSLTDPDDLLTTGVDVAARPAGKRVTRLSLLSGGERSLVALAIAFAIFAARPSPFYVLDEVEAALDDVNLQRVLDVMRDFRASSQLIVVTHQKRTMEIADVLYGITMRAGGVSKVLSQRLTDVA